MDMILEKIIKRCDALSVYEERCASDEYYEIVFYTKDTDEWNKIFINVFGHPIKPAGARPTKHDLRLTKNYKGVYDNQTLFKKEFDDVTVIAMFWPWEDGNFTTLKMAVLRKL
ncbi:hypothetical protein OAA99_00965 [Omnitrophica bacterium]|nr:hypothetical protein [Candidatus Omnitrophota bacterium]